ncbi:unnamed protein product [Dovyalis caffra]|uniref:Uncharacterized protein n=1 Tax=Dovyalis caffra TaxID=77055 RepID=A0AAV1S7P2_9ROSI|nr:unnamed protein product [Dovyalis caffra]
MGSSNRNKLEVFPVVVRGEGFYFMHDERLDRRLKRKNVGTQSFKANSTGKSNICKDSKALKSSPDSVCIQKDGHDSDVGDEDYMKFYDGLVRGLFVDSDAHLDIKPSSFKKNNGRYGSSKCTKSPANAPKSSSCILLDDDDENDEVDGCNIKFLKDLNGGLYNGSDCDACVDIEYALSKKQNGVRSTDNVNVSVDLVKGLVENHFGGIGAVDGGCMDASLDSGNANTSSVDDDTTPMSPADGIANVGTVHVGKGDARAGDDNIVDDGHLNNGIVREEAGDDGNNADDGSVGDGADNNEDPDYEMFLDNYRQDKKSCVLEFSLTNEITVTVRYDSQDGCKIEKPDTERDCLKSKNTGNRKLLKIDSRSDRMEATSDTMKKRVEALRKLRDVPARERKFSVFEGKMKKEHVNLISCRADRRACKRPSPEDLCPTNCKRKCETKLDMAQRTLRDVPSREIKVSAVESNLNVETVDLSSYRANEGASKRPSPEALGLTHKVKPTMVNHRAEIQRKSRVSVPSREGKVSAVKSKLRKESIDPVSCRENVHARKRPVQETIGSYIYKRKCKMHSDTENCRMETQTKMKDVPVKERGNLAVERNLEKHSLNAVPQGGNGHANKKPSPQAPSSTNCKCKYEMNLDMVDHSYHIFLNSLKKDGGYVVFGSQNGKGVLYKSNEQSSSDSEVIVMDTNQLLGGIDTPFVISKVRISEDEDWRDNGVSGKFREELMKILEKPYNEREYEELWQTISHRGRVERDIDLRSGSKRCETKAIGKSYLDHHPDLEAKIQLAKSDKPKILNLMRGFFYWLMNTSHGGSGVFLPWLDSSCLKMQPQHNKGMSLITLE